MMQTVVVGYQIQLGLPFYMTTCIHVFCRVLYRVDSQESSATASHVKFSGHCILEFSLHTT